MSAFRGRRILVADDETTNQRVLRAMFLKLGCEALIVGNGRMAVEAARAGSFDLVLMDLQMPEMDGLSAAREIRTFARTPIVAISGTAADRAVLAAAGIDDALEKPVRLEELMVQLARWIT